MNHFLSYWLPRRPLGLVASAKSRHCFSSAPCASEHEAIYGTLMFPSLMPPIVVYVI